jgi:tricorn protease
MYDPDGKWFLEGHGVDPDIPVTEDPASLVRGIDNQLEKAVEEVTKLIATRKFVIPNPPEKEIR